MICIMGEWVSTLGKIIIGAVIVAVIVATSWNSVDIQAVYNSANVSAHSAVANKANYQLSALNGAKAVLPNANLDSVQQVGNNLVQSTVSYTPRNTLQGIYNFLGIPLKNQTITMTGTAEGSLDTLNLTVQKSISAGESTSFVGSLVDGSGNAIANATIALNVTNGTLQSNRVTTDTNGNFIVNFTAPDQVTNITITASSNNATVSETVAIVANVTITSATVAVVGQSVTVKGIVTNGATGISNQIVSLMSDPSVIFSNNGSTTTDANGVFSITFTAPSQGEILNLVANCDGGYSNPPFSLNVIAPIVNFNSLSYSVGVDQNVTVYGDVTLGGNPVPNQTVTFSQSSNLANLSNASTTTDANGNFSYTMSTGNISGNESIFASSGGGTGVVPLTVTGAKITFSNSSYNIGVTQLITLSGTITSANQAGNQIPLSISSSQTINFSGISLGDFAQPSFGTSTMMTTTNGSFAVVYQANLTTGMDIVNAYDSSLGASGSTKVTINPAQVIFTNSSYTAPLNSSLTVSGSVTSLNSSGGQSNITMSTNVALSMSTNYSGSPFPTSVSTTNGNFSYTFTTSNSPYSSTMIASALGGTGYASIATDAPNIVLTTSQNSVSVNGGQSTITINVSNGSVGLSGQPVQISVSGNGTLNSTSGTTDSQGNVVVTFTASSVTTGTTITATCDGATGSTSIAVVPVITNITFGTSSWPPTVVVSGQGFGVSASNLLSLSATCGNTSLNVITNYYLNDGSKWVSGCGVLSYGTWTNTQINDVGSGSNLSFTNYGGGNGIWLFHPNDTVNFTVTNPLGQSVSANATYPSNAPMPTFANCQSNNSVPLYGSQITYSGYLYLNGNSSIPIPNVPVNISFSGGNIGTFSNGSTSISVMTNSQGYFSTVFTTNSTVGSGYFVVTTPIDNSTTSTWQANGYYTFANLSTNTTSASPSATLSLSGNLYFYDGGNQGWAGMQVTISDSLGSTPVNVTTGANGYFSCSFVLGTNGGSDTITATMTADSNFKGTFPTVSVFQQYYWKYTVMNNSVYTNGASLSQMASPWPSTDTIDSIGTSVHDNPIVGMTNGGGVWKWNGSNFIQLGGSNSMISTQTEGGPLSSGGQLVNITQIVTMPNGDIVCGTDGDSLDEWINSTNSWINVVAPANFNINSLTVLPSGQLLIDGYVEGTETSPGVWSFTSLLPSNSPLLSAYYYLFGTCSSNGTIYLVSETNPLSSSGIYEPTNVWTWNGTQFVLVGSSSQQSSMFSNYPISSISVLQNGNVVGIIDGGNNTPPNGIIEFNGSTWNQYNFNPYSYQQLYGSNYQTQYVVSTDLDVMDSNGDLVVELSGNSGTNSGVYEWNGSTYTQITSGAVTNQYPFA